MEFFHKLIEGFLLTLLTMISRSEGTCRHLAIKRMSPGKVLVNHTVDRIQPSEQSTLCASKCYLEPLCFSYNFCEDHISGSLCELLDSDHIRHGEHLVDKEGCTYYGSETSCSSNPCANNATCQGDFSGEDKPYRCVCPRGITGQNCGTDINECMDGIHGCHVNATCTNVIGGHVCSCKNGFYGDGRQCYDEDECTDVTHICHVNATCSNVIGGHECTCKKGFYGNGIQCYDEDECANSTHSCHVNATCTNMIGGHNCTCKSSFFGNGSFCKRPKSCEELKLFLPSNTPNGHYEQELVGGGVGKVFCSYESYSECGAGPWTLAMKIDGSKANFRYNSVHWSQKSVFNPDGSVGGLDREETVSPAYWTTPLTKLCLGMRYNNALNWILINVNAMSLHHVMVNQMQIETHLGEAKWRSLLTKTSLQQNCNMEGFNLRCGRKLRLGYFKNQEKQCKSCDSYIGLGVDISSTVCGNRGKFNADHGDVNIQAFCYILVQ